MTLETAATLAAIASPVVAALVGIAQVLAIVYGLRRMDAHNARRTQIEEARGTREEERWRRDDAREEARQAREDAREEARQAREEARERREQERWRREDARHAEAMEALRQQGESLRALIHGMETVIERTAGRP